jgi:hypothetical protein
MVLEEKMLITKVIASNHRYMGFLTIDLATLGRRLKSCRPDQL